MESNNYSLFNKCPDSNDSQLSLLEHNLLNDLNGQKFEIDHFLTSMPENERELILDFTLTNQNCSFDSISTGVSNECSKQSNDQYNSSASSSTSELYSPIQITPPETPPSCEINQNNQLTDIKFKKTKRTTTKKLKQIDRDVNKKKKLVPLAPKTNTIAIIQLNPTCNTIFDHQIMQQIPTNNLFIKNNDSSLNCNFNNHNVLANQIQPINVPETVSIIEEKTSKEELSRIREKARRQRNRQSAQLSRQKKIDYVKGIEKKLKDLTDENQNLRKENHILKNLVNKLTFENDQIKNLQNKLNITNDYFKYSPDELSSSTIQKNIFYGPGEISKTKKTISLLAIIFLIGLNMNLYNDNFKTYELTRKLPNNKIDSKTFKGRVLLWSDSLDSSIRNLNKSINVTRNCNENFVSQNETLILESKLRNWAIHQTNKQQFYLSSKNLNSNFANAKKWDETSSEHNKLPWYLGIRNWNQVDGSGQKKLYSTNDESLYYEEIINSVKPKIDTYYFLSLNPADHLILPLNFYSNNSKNNLLRKSKFSLLLPTMNSQFFNNFTNSTNETKELQKNQFLQLIEIHFDVINMKPLQVLKIRNHLNHKNRFTNRRIINRNPNTFSYNKTAQINSALFASHSTKLLKPILLHNQNNPINVQSQLLNKTFGV